MKIKQNDIKLLLFLFGILACVVSHYMIRTPLEEEMVTLAISIEAETAERARLKEVLAISQQMTEEIAESQIIVENEMLKYPEDILVEDFILYANQFSEDMEMELAGVAITTPTQVSTMNIMRKVNDADMAMTIAAYRTSWSLTMDFGYDKLKSYIEYVHSDQERTVVENISISYNASTGRLTGSSTINKYFIATPNYVYTPPDLPLTEFGNDNPFGTVE